MGRYWSTIKGRRTPSPPYLQPHGWAGPGGGSQRKLLDKVRFKVRSEWMLRLGSPSEVPILFILYPQDLEQGLSLQHC